MRKTHRHFTLQEQHTSSKWNKKVYPSLHISCKWLQECGFSPKDKVKITVSQEVLIIELLK